jgi:hypothetical protein
VSQVSAHSDNGSGGRHAGRCLTTRQYARLISEWIASIGLDPSLHGTHSLRRTKATLNTSLTSGEKKYNMAVSDSHQQDGAIVARSRGIANRSPQVLPAKPFPITQSL